VPHHSTNHKGNIAEAEIAAAAVRLGIDVLKPLVEHGRYDLAFDLGTELLRVQCKWASFGDGVIKVQLSGNYLTAQGYVYNSYTADEIDAVAVYCSELDRCYLLPAELVVGRRAIYLRVEPTKNAQRAALNWATEYELGAVAQLGRASRWHREGRGFESHQLHSDGSTEPPRLRKVAEVGAHVFRNHFGWYMQRAHAGEEILITRRGRPHARLGPPHPQLGAPSQPLASENGDASGGRIDAPGPYRSHEPTSTR
jgi:prevent-host-death family protein